MHDDPYKSVQKGKGLGLKKSKKIGGEKNKVSENSKITKDINVQKRTSRTAAEQAFEKAQQEKQSKMDQSKSGRKSHKEKVRNFNEKLSKLSDHYDIPKVGPG